MQFPFCALLPWREGLGSCPRGPMKLQSGSVVQYLHLAPCGLKLQEEDSIYCTKRKTHRNGNVENEIKREATTLHAAVASAHGNTRVHGSRT